MLVLSDILDIAKGLHKLREMKLKKKFAFKLSRASRKAQEILKSYEEERQRLIKEHALHGDNGKPLEENGQYKIVDPDALAAAHTELLESDVDDFNVELKLSDFPDDIDPETLYLLDAILTE